jgi:hypothetical protein
MLKIEDCLFKDNSVEAKRERIKFDLCEDGEEITISGANNGLNGTFIVENSNKKSIDLFIDKNEYELTGSFRKALSQCKYEIEGETLIVKAPNQTLKETIEEKVNEKDLRLLEDYFVCFYSHIVVDEIKEDFKKYGKESAGSGVYIDEASELQKFEGNIQGFNDKTMKEDERDTGDENKRFNCAEFSRLTKDPEDDEIIFHIGADGNLSLYDRFGSNAGFSYKDAVQLKKFLNENIHDDAYVVLDKAKEVGEKTSLIIKADYLIIDEPLIGIPKKELDRLKKVELKISNTTDIIIEEGGMNSMTRDQIQDLMFNLINPNEL